MGQISMKNHRHPGANLNGNLQGDRIALSQIDANSALAGDQAFGFIGTAAFSGNAGELRYEVVGAGVIVYGDVDGDGLADFQFQVDGVTALLSSHFIL